MVERVLAKVRSDNTLPDSLRRLTAADLLGHTSTGYVRAFDDSSSALFMKATAATLHQLPEPLCGGFLTPGSHAGDLDIMFPYADSSTLNRWAIILERLVYVRARRSHVAARMATDAEVRAAFLGVPARLTEVDRQRLLTIARTPPPTQRDACWSCG
jgi:hypothetical protein